MSFLNPNKKFSSILVDDNRSSLSNSINSEKGVNSKTTDPFDMSKHGQNEFKDVMGSISKITQKRSVKEKKKSNLFVKLNEQY